jgi:hypothetical protein
VYEYTERVNNKRMPEKIVTATTEGMRKRVKPRKRWIDEVERGRNRE